MVTINSNQPSINEVDNWLTAIELSDILGGSCLSYVRSIFKGLDPKLDSPSVYRDTKIHPLWRVEKRADKGRKLCLHRSQLSDFSRHYGLDAPKTDEWLSQEDIIQHFSNRAQSKISDGWLWRIINKLQHPNQYTSQKSSCDWQIAERRYKKSFVTCLHVSELERFGKQYRLNAPQQIEGWLTAKELAEKLDVFKDRNRHKFEEVFDRLSPTEDPFIMCDKVNGKNWQVRILNVKGVPMPCLNVTQLDDFATCYRPFRSDYAPATPEWLSAQDLADYMAAGNCQLIQTLFDKLTPVRTAGTTGVRQKTMYMLDLSGKHIWRMEEFGNVRHLHESQIEYFIVKNLLHRKLSINENCAARAEQLNLNLRFAS